MVKNRWVKFIFIMSLGFSSSAFAVGGEPTVYAGGLLGLSVPSASNSSARPMMGINAGAMLGTEFSVGGYYLYSGKKESSNGTDFDFIYQLYGVEAQYRFEGEAKGAFFGVRAGLSKVKLRVGSFEVETSPVHFGLVGGYDYRILPNVSLGGEISWMSLSQAETTTAGLTVRSDSFNTLNFLGSAKFWF